ncbi:Gfo/Idh/MocA family oxidoreductase [Niabella hibiscisoli]|uniref:Gfo/Idh/MocA family oxidoreductase n=1 Tax=Niabella hibiscisoli TaxID=1825928 RepID=UPI001F104E85|nr:Gfo/Idh/MocA family oxidoreductase [Niabella hibiscisoli]MCH5719069.1 Gfo/Idh/MocA family oxidoreductase [Niabella hibiscisoli]
MGSIKNNNSRRDFIRKTSLSATGLILLPSFLKASKGLIAGANEKVNLACIGIGNRGGEIIGEFGKTGLANIVALCDVDMGAPQTVKVMNMFPAAKRFQDFRKMFDQIGSQIDAVCIGVPDHSHFPITMHAMMLGKHVYVEKPLARTFRENELLMKAARKYNNIVTQMGNQGHSEANYFQFKTWVESGIIKDVTNITAHMNSPRRWHGWDPAIKSFPAMESTPASLDWDLWHSAVRKQHNYNKDFVNGQWRCWYDFGMGALGDWGAHILDTAHQFLDLGLPEEVNSLKSTGHNNFFFPMSSTIEFKFPKRGDKPPVTITWYDGIDNLPPIPEGYGVSGLDPNIPPPSTGTMEPVKLNPGKIIYSKDLTFKGASHGSTLSIIPEQKAKDLQSQLPQVPQSTSNHYKNFLLACKGLEETRSPFEIAGPLSQVFSLGVLAQQTNGQLKFDRAKKKITNHSIANSLLEGAPPRKGWEQYYKV